MTKRHIASLVLTGFFILGVLPGAIMNIVQPDLILEIAEPLGIPTHILTLVGLWKLLGVVALLVPNLPRLREWAYAGFFFDLTGAAWWHGGAGDLAGVAPPLVLCGLLLASYGLRR